MKKLLSFILVCVLVFALNACSVDSLLDKVSNGSNSSGGVSTNNTTDPVKVGETGEVNNIAVTFLSVETSTGSQFIKPEDGKVFVLCEFDIANNSSKDIIISSMINFKAFCNGYECDYSVKALFDKGDKETLDTSVTAGKKAKGVVGFVVPSDWTELEIQFTPDILSGNKLTFIAYNN